MLFCFRVKWLQVKWYISFQSLYAVSLQGKMVAGKMVHHFKNSAFGHSMMFNFKVKWLQV